MYFGKNMHSKNTTISFIIMRLFMDITDKKKIIRSCKKIILLQINLRPAYNNVA